MELRQITQQGRKRKTNKRTSVEKAERSVRQYEAKVQRKREKVKRQYIYDTQRDYDCNKTKMRTTSAKRE